MKRLLIVVGSLMCIQLQAQLLTWTPNFAKDNDNITITVDATKGNQGLNNYTPVSDVYVHIGVITNLSTSPTNWRYAPFTWGTTTPAAQATSIGGNKWQFTINNIRTYFGVPPGETIYKIAILFRNGSGSLAQRNADGSDMFVPVYDNGIAVRFSVPPFQPLYTPIPEPISKQVGDNISVTGIANQTADMKLYLNGTVILSTPAVTTISANPTLTTAGNTEIVVEGTASSVTKKDTLRFFVTPAITVAPLPAGVRDGINYEAGNTSIVLVLYAPGKSRVSVIGEFPGSNWTEQTSYVMNKTPDGNYWWLRVTGLTPGTEYAFQYLVDGTLKVAEPYSEKILDPNWDSQISSSTYPGLRAYPTGLTTGIVSIVQTNAPSYTWTNNTFSRPDKRNLVVYELLMRDFIAAHDWNTLRDTITYLKNLGVNAIEIMPFTDADYQGSWGYDPNFYFAPDKFFGPKNTLKRFVDSCHSKGIAVLLDLVLNHATGTCPLAALYWNSTTNQPAANNPWFNVTATHPFSVFNDFNHESLATRYFSSRVMEHWLSEYKLDGFRFDLSKGFTQNANCGASQTNVNCWGQYDQSRVDIWKRYYDTLQLKSPGCYAILEHFAANTEEIALSNYGMMLWGNLAYNFEQASMGYADASSDFSSLLHTVRGWSNPYLVGYMESHDEERMMYKNINFGNSSGSYDVRDLNTALRRIELCGSFFLTAPGPKMIWEFGELGFDYSINRCLAGTIADSCRLTAKPIRWDYLQVVQRKRVYDVFASLDKLRFHPWYKDVFIANNITVTPNLTGAFKTMTLRSANDTSMICVIGNFDVTAQTSSFIFPHSGTWYDYLTGGTFSATGGSQNMTLQPGEYHVYLNRNLINAVVTAIPPIGNPDNMLSAIIYSNPAQSGSVLSLNMPNTAVVQADLINTKGQFVKTIFKGSLTKGKHDLPLADKTNNIPAGTYLVRVQTSTQVRTVKLIVQ